MTLTCEYRSKVLCNIHVRPFIANVYKSKLRACGTLTRRAQSEEKKVNLTNLAVRFSLIRNVLFYLFFSGGVVGVLMEI